MGASDHAANIEKNSRRRLKRFSLIRNLALLAVTVTFISAPLVEAPPVLAAADVLLSISSGPPGTDVIVAGNGFTSGNTYSITFDPGTLYEQIFITNEPISGTTFSEVITIPPTPWAQHTIRVDTSVGTFLKTFQVVPEIETQINGGYVGDTVAVTGNGFRASGNVNIYFNNTVVATATTDVYGTLAQSSFQVPALRSSNYNINANDGAASSPAVIFIIRSRLILSVDKGPVDSQIVFNGTGFDYSSQITVLWDNQLTGASFILTNGTGSFSANFTIPAGTVGNHMIRVSDATLRLANVYFNIVPEILLNPVNGTPGNAVTLTGTGFRPNTSVTFTYNGITAVTQPQLLITSAAGGFSATFVVPNGTAGNYIVWASDGAFSATAIFGSTSKIEITPANGNVGTVLQVNGLGFTPAGKVNLTYDTQQIATSTIDATGSFTASFTVPASKAGAHIISAADQTVISLIVTATFTMESTPPPKPNLQSPETGSQAAITPNFSWSAVTDPSGVTYSLQVALDATFSNMVLSRPGLTNTVYTVTQAEVFRLTKKTSPYYWRVKAIDGAGNESDWTATATFYTQDSTPPPVPLPLSPANDSQSVVLLIFDWSDVSDPSGVTYSLQVARDTGFSQLVIYKQGLNTSNYQTGAAEQLGLTKRTSPYYWRVKAVDGAANESDWTSPLSFYTQDSTPPVAPVALRPEQGSTQGNEPTFDWSAATDPSGVTYTLQVSQDSSFNRVVVIKEGLTILEYKLSNTEKLGVSTASTPSYYWRVKAIDGAGNESGWSNGVEFKVRNSLWSGWLVYVTIVIGVLALLAVGVLIGMRLKTKKTAIK